MHYYDPAANRRLKLQRIRTSRHYTAHPDRSDRTIAIDASLYCFYALRHARIGLETPLKPAFQSGSRQCIRSRGKSRINMTILWKTSLI
jgi:hypothetical protein